jgi:uncharacterized protein with FMN-binding domain
MRRGEMAMNITRRKKVAAAAVASAVGLGVLTWGLRTLPAVRLAIAQLNRQERSASIPVAGFAAGNTSTVRNAFLVWGSGAQTSITRTAAYSLKDGTFTGKREYAYYGYVKVQAIIRNGSLTDVKILEYPNDNGRSHYINNVALPYLIQEAVDAQTYKVDFISGATFTSSAFIKSLQEALKPAGL